jgi:hypothetical protein
MIVPRHLARAAAFELQSREKHYPAMVAGQSLSAEEAQADWRAWRAIARFTAGEPIGDDISWAELEHATSNALIRREQACQAKPDNRGLAERRDLVAAIHQAISHNRAWIDDLNAALRRRAEQERAAA